MVVSESAVLFVSFHIDGREGTCWTEILACSAADAIFLVDGRNHS